MIVWARAVWARLLPGPGGYDTHHSSLAAEKTLTIDFQFEDLGLKLKGSGQSVLSGVSGEIRCGFVVGECVYRRV